ncbi:unnamed protein product [Pleuronectes platessa]|uniref:Uncharacterized protein n=1 Tax=Pleuronectes platessa TaxID=8262 RepID=A0A9N7ZCW2_PLEPL|nr:unnamed protein product [Pleuronectes platessa]
MNTTAHPCDRDAQICDGNTGMILLVVVPLTERSNLERTSTGDLSEEDPLPGTELSRDRREEQDELLRRSLAPLDRRLFMFECLTGALRADRLAGLGVRTREEAWTCVSAPVRLDLISQHGSACAVASELRLQSTQAADGLAEAAQQTRLPIPDECITPVSERMNTLLPNVFPMGAGICEGGSRAVSPWHGDGVGDVPTSEEPEEPDQGRRMRSRPDSLRLHRTLCPGQPLITFTHQNVEQLHFMQIEKPQVLFRLDRTQAAPGGSPGSPPRGRTDDTGTVPSHYELPSNTCQEAVGRIEKRAELCIILGSTVPRSDPEDVT